MAYFVLFGFVISLANGEDFNSAFTKSTLGSIILIISAFVNLALLVFLEKKLMVNKRAHRRKFLLLSYGFSYLVFLLVSYGYASFLGETLQWRTFVYVGVICIMINTLILAFQNVLILHDTKMKADMENSQLRAANADAANQLLRQQIQPHFLFNALNILKSLYKVNPKAGEEYLVRLSGFLRAAVSNHNIKVIPLKEELKLCRDYLDMQKIRFGNALVCTIIISDKNLEKGFVPSFSIQPLLENAIKHNELTEEAPLRIQIRENGDRVQVTNNVKLKSTSESGTQSGLANLAERYKLISGDELVIEPGKDIFSVSLKILSNENSNY